MTSSSEMEMVSIQSPTRSDEASEVPSSLSGAEALCERCADALDDEGVNVEAFELSGEIVCGSCAEDIFEDNGQFGLGA